MEFKIDKGIEYPLSPGKWMVLIHKLEVGDSFYVPDQKEKSRRELGSAILQAGRKSRTGMKLSYRQVEGGIRVWRIK